jgi:hypothetical protein
MYVQNICPGGSVADFAHARKGVEGKLTGRCQRRRTAGVLAGGLPDRPPDSPPAGLMVLLANWR